MMGTHAPADGDLRDRGARRAVLHRRLAASAALALGLASVAILAVLVVLHFWRGLLGAALFAGALAAAWLGLVRRGGRRVLGLAAGAVQLTGGAGLLVAGNPALVLGCLAALALGLVAAAQAFRVAVALSPAPRPARPVLVFNPRSGGGKALRFHLQEAARDRGIQSIELTPGADLAALVRAALDDGADALAVAGGDGSQAIAAAIAAARGVPYACIPAGTRNHFALDLGVDRDDVVGALDALVDGGERLVDLGEVNGRTFVNNVSLGIYGHAVQRRGYREAKVQTLLEVVPDVLGPGASPDLRWRGPDAEQHAGGAAIVVSNNPYRLGHVLGAGTRPRLDAGVLGVAVLGAPGDGAGARAWTTPAFEIQANGPVPAGIDGEAVVLDPPLRFRVRPGVLRCRIARRHPGASTSAFTPDDVWAAIRILAGIAVGHDPRPVPGAPPPERS